MISTVTNQGKTRWMIVDDAFNSDKLIEFLAALVKDTDKKIFLILDNLRVHHSKPVKAWLADHKDQIEVFYCKRPANPGSPRPMIRRRWVSSDAARARRCGWPCAWAGA